MQRWRANPDDQPAVATTDDGLSSFLLIWVLVPIVIFSISRAKLPGYILPAIPAAVLLTADSIHQARTVSRAKIALHALVCAFLMVAALMAPFAMAKVPPPSFMQVGMIVTGGVIAVMVMLMVRREGVRVLHFVTLVPAILAVAFLLRPAAETIDRTQSARPIAVELSKYASGNETVAVFNVKRDIAYGLTFYRNQKIWHYEQDGLAPDMHSRVPDEQHVVIVKQGSIGAVQAVVGNRTVTPIGAFRPRQLEFFRVGPAK